MLTVRLCSFLAETLSYLSSCISIFSSRASLVAQMVKINLPAVQETQVRSLDQEDPLEKGMAAHSSILAWRIPVDREAWRAAFHGVTKSQT